MSTEWFYKSDRYLLKLATTFVIMKVGDDSAPSAINVKRPQNVSKNLLCSEYKLIWPNNLFYMCICVVF